MMWFARAYLPSGLMCVRPRWSPILTHTFPLSAAACNFHTRSRADAHVVVIALRATSLARLVPLRVPRQRHPILSDRHFADGRHQRDAKSGGARGQQRASSICFVYGPGGTKLLQWPLPPAV